MIQSTTLIEDNTTEFQPKSLKLIYKEYLLSEQFPTDFLKMAIAKCRERRTEQEWHELCSTTVPSVLPPQEGVHKEHKLYYYPEWNEERQQMEIRTFDPYHTFNNIRNHICNKGYVGITKKAWIRVSKKNNDLLPKIVITEHLDKQNVAITERFFSKEVEQVMRSNGDIHEAEFVSIVRNWYRALDERGLSVPERLNYMEEFNEYLHRNFKLEYPPPTTHLNLMPVRTYEAIRQINSARFLLYFLNSGYNQRSISTLDVESFFSDLTRSEFTGLGMPKAVDVPKLISRTVKLNAIKHSADRGFEFHTSSKLKYPYHEMQAVDPTASTLECKPYRTKKSKWSGIGTTTDVTKGARPVRQFFRIDESKLPLDEREGISTDIDMTDY